MILLYTDFGVTGPYTGQVKAVLARSAPGIPVVDLMADAPALAPKPAAYLLAALAAEMPGPATFICVVDPCVGMPRRALAVQADDKFFVGPDNGLLEIVRRRAVASAVIETVWQPPRLSASFHGRDLFAPVAARLALHGWEAMTAPDFRPVDPQTMAGADWPDDLAEIVYIDPYGNAMTGLRTAALSPNAGIRRAGQELPRARTFAEVPVGAPLVYDNSCGLLEIAVNGGSAAERFGMKIGEPVLVHG